MPIRVNLPNGGVANFPDGTPPQEIERALADVQLTAPLPELPTSFDTKAPSPTNYPGILSPSTRERMDQMNDREKAGISDQSQFVKEHPIQTAAYIALAGGALPMLKAVPGVIGRAATAATSPMGNKVIGGTLGAADGYRRGGIEGAVLEGAAGVATGSKVGARLRKLFTRTAPPSPSAMDMGKLSDLGRANARFDEILAEVRASRAAQAGAPAAAPVTPPTAAPTAAPASPASAQSSLAQEMLKREPNWRLTDAVPIDAMKRDVINGGTIIEAGESQPGLATRLADLLKKPTPSQLAEAERLAKALRQRGHIQARTQ